MRSKNRLWVSLLVVMAALALAGLGAGLAFADDEGTPPDHVFAGLLNEDGAVQGIYVAGEPGYEELMWHQVGPAEFAAIAHLGAGAFDITWYVNALPGTIHIDETA